MKGDADLVLPGDDVVVGDDVAFFADDNSGALALGGIVPDAVAATEIEEFLGALADGVDADDGGDYGFGEPSVFLVEPGEHFDIADIECGGAGWSECLHAVGFVLF